MRKTLPKNTYTQINTNAEAYLIQNLSKYSFGVVVSDDDPGDGAVYDFIIESNCGIGNNHIEGIIWGKPTGSAQVVVGIVEE